MSETRERDAVPPQRKLPDGERRAAANDALDVEPLMTVCPDCGTRFRVTEAQLQAARGRVRCGACGAVFDGVDQLVLDAPREFASSHDAAQALDELMAELMADRRVMPPPQAAEQLAEAPEASVVADRVPAGVPEGRTEIPEPDAFDLPDRQPGSQHAPQLAVLAEVEVSAGATDGACEVLAEARTARAIAAPAQADAVAVPAAASTDGPVVFVRPRSRGLLWLTLLVPLGLAASAGLVLWLQFDTLIRDPAWRPTYERLCPIVGCEVPVRRSLALVRPRNLTVQSAGAGTDELVVRVQILNDAEFAQPFPVLQLSFSDLEGLPLAGHRFQPRDYLAGDASNLELMPVRTPVQLELRIPDPGPNAVNYQLDLL